MSWKFVYDKYLTKIPDSNGKKAILAIGNVQSGKTRFMINETKAALEGDFDIVIILAGSNNLLMDQSYKRFVTEMKTSNIRVKEIKTGAVVRIHDGYKLVITALKHQDSIDKLISTAKALPDKKIMIFDDESDFGGINIGGDKKSLIYSKLHELYENLYSGVYISVTATPYADVLSDDSFEFDDVIKLQPGQGYTGVTEFNSSNAYVSLKEPELLRLGESNDVMMRILIDHIKRACDSNSNITQLLINPSLRKKDHFKLQENMAKILGLIVETNILSNLIADVEKVKKAEDIAGSLLENIYVLNEKQSSWNQNSHSIIIGGALISRGYTFEHLLTCILVNVPKGKIGADVLLQRARWFGYRNNLELIKVYLPKKAIDGYEEVERLNEIVYGSDDVDEMKELIEDGEFEVITPTGKVKIDEAVIFKR